MARLGTEGALRRPGALHRPVPAAWRTDASRGRPHGGPLLLRARSVQGLRRGWLGGRVEASLLRVGVQGEACKPRRRVRSAEAVRTRPGEPAPADRLGHEAVSDSDELDQLRQQDAGVRAGRPHGRRRPRQAQVGDVRPGAAPAGRDQADADRNERRGPSHGSRSRSGTRATIRRRWLTS